jgi:hypothetical protein
MVANACGAKGRKAIGRSGFIQTVRQIGADETVQAFDVGQRKLAYKS